MYQFFIILKQHFIRSKAQQTGRVETERGGHVVRVDALDRLAEARHHRMNLLRQVVLGVELERLRRLEELGAQVGALRSRVAGAVLAHNVGDHVAIPVLLAVGHVLVEAERDEHVRLMICVAVVLWVPVKLLGDLEQAQVIRALSDLLGRVAEALVDAGEHQVTDLAGQDLADHLLADLLGQGAPVAAHHVQALDLLLVLEQRRVSGIPADHGQRGVLLLAQEQQTLEHAIDVDLQVAVQLVHLGLEHIAELDHLLVVGQIGVDHDRVGVAVDHLDFLTLNELLGLHEQTAAELGDQSGERFAVETRVLEAQAAVQAVGGELQRFLANIVLLEII